MVTWWERWVPWIADWPGKGGDIQHKEMLLKKLKRERTNQRIPHFPKICSVLPHPQLVQDGGKRPLKANNRIGGKKKKIVRTSLPAKMPRGILAQKSPSRHLLLHDILVYCVA